RSAVKTWRLGLVVVLTITMYFAGLNPLVPLFGLAILVMLVENRTRLGALSQSAVLLLPAAALEQTSPAGFSLVVLFITFLKIGATLYGSGYVLLAFLHDDFVNRLHWLTDQELLDAIAVGQFTPGPVFTTATFIGYLVGGVRGAVAATVAIFFPAFVFVAVSHPFIPRLRRSPWAGALLDGINVASLALMAGVTWQLGRVAVTDVTTAALALASVVLLVRTPVNSAWLVATGAA